MTNSYNSSQRPKIVFIHGLNNKASAFTPLMEVFSKKGHEVELVILPGHGENRKEARSLQEAFQIFEERMNQVATVPFAVVAFSQGALYLNLWMERHPQRKPVKQVLIAPAFAIRHQKIVAGILRRLPSFVLIKSLSPKIFRRYSMLKAEEYLLLIQGIHRYQESRQPFHTSTLILIDPKDELVDAQKLKGELKEVELWQRPYLKKGLGQHHVLFHPDYFSEEDWTRFIKKIENFLFT